jgi:hypothetical protein
MVQDQLGLNMAEAFDRGLTMRLMPDLARDDPSTIPLEIVLANDDGFETQVLGAVGIHQPQPAVPAEHGPVADQSGMDWTPAPGSGLPYPPASGRDDALTQVTPYPVGYWDNYTLPSDPEEDPSSERLMDET